MATVHSIARLGVALSVLILSPAYASKVKPTHEILEFSVKITWVEAKGEIRRAARRLGISPPNDSKGFGVLTRNSETGQYTCRIYTYRPTHVDDDATTSMGHELAHCSLGKYHR